MELGNIIKRYRLREGFTQEKLAEQLGVSFQTISKWENNVCMPDIEMLPHLSILFGVTIDELFSLTSDQKFKRIDNMLNNERELSYSVWQENVDFLKSQLDICEDKGMIYNYLARIYHHRICSDSCYVEEYVKKALKESPDDENVQWLLHKSSGSAIRDFSEKSHHKIIDLFYEIIDESDGSCERNYFALLNNLIADNRSDEAEEVLIKYENSKVYNPLRKLIYQARIADAKGECEKANEIRNIILDKYKDDELAMYELANIYASKCDYTNAIKMYEASFELESKPRYIDALRGIEICYEIMKDFKMAAEYCDKQIEVLRDEWDFEKGEVIESIERRKSEFIRK